MFPLLAAPPPAPPGGTGSPVAGLAGLLALVLLAYLASCWWWPFRFCRRCHGGKRTAPVGRVFRNCPSCGGTGRHTRTGTKLLHHFTRHRRARRRQRRGNKAPGDRTGR